MLKLQPKPKVKETQQIVVSETNYSKEQINSLFELGRFTPVLFYKSKAKRLFDLGLSFDDSKYLLQTKKLNVDEIVKCISELKLDVDLIRNLTCSKDVLLTDIPNIISMVGGVECLRILTEKRLSIENIKTLFQQLKLNYNDTISLTNSGYKVHEIEALINGKISCSELVDLASVVKASEVYSMFVKDRQNIVFLLSVISVSNKTVTDIDSSLACYQTIYDNVPNDLCQSIINCVSLIPSIDNISGDNLTYEDILIHYMNLAGGKILDYVGNTDIAEHISFELLEKTSRTFRQTSDYVDEFFTVKPLLLTSIWSALQVSLESKYLKNVERINLKVIVRSTISFWVSSICGVTGYFHSGGSGLPCPNVTSYIKTYFNIQHLIKDNAPKVYDKIPKCLLFDTDQSFNSLIKEKQISAAQGLSMVYTFRVGNAFLCNLLGDHIFSKESAKNMFKSLWPLPQEAESIRMYFIYSGIPIYSKLNLKDVFVSIS